MDDGLMYTILTDQARLDAMDDWCQHTHGETGLAGACLDPARSLPLEQAQAGILQYIQDRVSDARIAPLAGNSVHMDKFFMMRLFPQVGRPPVTPARARFSPRCIVLRQHRLLEAPDRYLSDFARFSSLFFFRSLNSCITALSTSHPFMNSPAAGSPQNSNYSMKRDPNAESIAPCLTFKTPLTVRLHRFRSAVYKTSH